MRERTTWSREAIIKLATSPKIAEDPRAMNQDHLKQQPSADKYVTGDPSAFAEDVHPSTTTWKAEYSGDEVKRNEIGMPELRSDTFNHSEKTAADDEQDDEDDDFLEKKAEVCLRLARRVLTKTASSEVLEDQALAFMHLPNEALIDTVTRLAAQDEEEEQQKAQQKEAGKIPPQFLENVKKKKEEAADKDDEDKGQQKQAQQDEGQQAQAQDQQKQAQQDEGQQAQAQDQGQQKQAQHEQIAQLQQQAQQIQQQIAQLEQQAQGQQQVQSQAQQIAQAVQQAIAQGQDPVQACSGLLAQLQGQPVAQQVQDQGLGDDQLFDQVIQQQPVMANVDSMDIELENNLMDVGSTHLANEDEVLRALFANEETQDAEQAQQLQQKQAGVRTASTRTVGTRPSAGVSQIGGRVASTTSNDVDKLSSLWQSSPDVRNFFGS